MNTSIAFGYSAESYIDFGVPLMFVPVFAFGLLIGVCYTVFRSLIWHRELFVSFATVSFWISVYLFERSWATMLGVDVGFMVYLGGPMVLLDRFLMIQFAAKQAGQTNEVVLDTRRAAAVLDRCGFSTSRHIFRRRGRTAGRPRRCSGCVTGCSARASTSTS